MSSQRLKAFLELGDHTTNVVKGMGHAWHTLKQVADDPVALDKFSIQCATTAQALGLLADRAQQLAADLFDGEEDED